MKCRVDDQQWASYEPGYAQDSCPLKQQHTPLTHDLMVSDWPVGGDCDEVVKNADMTLYVVGARQGECVRSKEMKARKGP